MGDIISCGLLPRPCVASRYITNIYILFWGSELISYNNGRGRCGIDCIRRCIVGTPAVGQRSKAVGVACLELCMSVRWLWRCTVFLSHIGGCTPDRVIWLATMVHSDFGGDIIMDTIANWACDAQPAGIGMYLRSPRNVAATQIMC
jgi:hypothetical protein